MIYINADRNRMVEFTIRKEIQFKNDNHAAFVAKNLDELQEKKNTFGDILIPNFTFEKNNNVVWYEAEYIKGNTVRSKHLVETLWKECVLRKDSITLSNYCWRNYIKCQDTQKLYYIDLNECMHMTMDERKESWNKSKAYLYAAETTLLEYRGKDGKRMVSDIN